MVPSTQPAKAGPAKCPNILKRWKKRPDCFILFADLDGTFTPMDLKGKIDFVNCIREMRDQAHVQVKFVPVSGRPCGYVLRTLHDTRDMLQGEDIKDVCDFGAAEQGALIVDSAKSYGPVFTGHPENKGLKAMVAEVMQAHEKRDIIVDEPDKLYTCSIHIYNEVKANMTNDQKLAVYRSVRDAVSAALGKKKDLSLAMSHNCLEVMTSEISKAYAIELLLKQYAETYNVVGCLYAGDAENDKVAMQYVSKLAEIPGITAHNYTPGNAQDSISTKVVDAWKYEKKIPARGYVQKGEGIRFYGIAELIRKAIADQTLCDTGIVDWYTKDDSLATVGYRRQSRRDHSLSLSLQSLSLSFRGTHRIPKHVDIKKLKSPLPVKKAKK